MLLLAEACPHPRSLATRCRRCHASARRSMRSPTADNTRADWGKPPMWPKPTNACFCKQKHGTQMAPATRCRRCHASARRSMPSPTIDNARADRGRPPTWPKPANACFCKQKHGTQMAPNSTASRVRPTNRDSRSPAHGAGVRGAPSPATRCRRCHASARRSMPSPTAARHTLQTVPCFCSQKHAPTHDRSPHVAVVPCFCSQKHALTHDRSPHVAAVPCFCSQKHALTHGRQHSGRLGQASNVAEAYQRMLLRAEACPHPRPTTLGPIGASRRRGRSLPTHASASRSMAPK